MRVIIDLRRNREGLCGEIIVVGNLWSGRVGRPKIEKFVGSFFCQDMGGEGEGHKPTAS